MVQPHRIPAVYTVILLLLLQASLEAKKPKGRLCPIGFKLAYSKTNGQPICYRLKGPEKITDTFKDCSGNLFTAKLYDSLNITNHTEQVLWTEYRSAYPGGPFIDTSFTPTAGSLLKTSFDVIFSFYENEEEFCVVKDPVANYTAERCDKEYYRYCFVEPYPEETLSTEDCESLRGSWRFWSPRPICLAAATGVGGGTVRATWSQSNEICQKRGGDILYSGWRYSNSPWLHVFESQNVYPLRVTYDPSHNTTTRNGNDFVRLPASFNLDERNASEEVTYGALRNGIWDLVNSSYIFYDVICEKDVDTKPVTLTVKADELNKLILTVDGNINESSIFCFTDSETFYPTPVKISFEDIYNKLLSYVLKPESDGNYWCIHIDSKRYQVSESQKVLWIREEESLKYTYAVKLQFNKEYVFDTVAKISKIWEKKLKDYIFYATNYYLINGDLDHNEDPKAFQETLKEFKESHPELSSRDKDVIYGTKIKRIHLDGKTALIHFQLNPMMKPVQPGWWSNMKVIYMKPVYYCSIGDLDFVNNITTSCEVHSCVGNFNEGVQAVTQSDQVCLRSALSPFNLEVTLSMPTMPAFTPPSIDDINQDMSDSSEEYSTMETPSSSTTHFITTSTWPETTTTTTTEEREFIVTNNPYPIHTPSIPPLDTVITVIPTFPSDLSTPTTTTSTLPPTTIPPQEQLQQVMQDLENLVNDESNILTVDVISESFDRVDELLNDNLSLEIPSELLHLLDDVGARLDLNGSQSAKTIRSNVALVVASAEPGLPVNGIRIASRDNDSFTDDAFEILRDDVNADHLTADSSEAVVHLPSSVANSSRRISFVVFRNDRAFQNNSTVMAVNSRILSINVENITQFKTGESVDIHFYPLLGDLDRNQSRTCAYWHFEDDGGGYWSQDGCRFIPASQPGMLDTCRCAHLTHFAEILISRTLFSERDEQILEILSVIGCCLSIFGVTMIGVTAILFRSWRRDFSNKIWLQLCIAIFFLVACFLIAVFAKFHTSNVGCMLVGIALHYSVLASFCWMLVAAVLSYRRLVMVFTRDASHKLLRASAFAWGTPFAVVGILLSVAPQSYSGQFEEKTPTGGFCYPSGLGLWLAVYAPIAVMLLANWTLFVLIVRSVFASTRIQRHGDSNEALRCASVSCLLVFLFGLPWIFGLFAYNVVVAYFFAITATFQGFVLFLFFVLGNKKTRDLWLNKLKIKQTRKVPVTSSTYTNRSTGPGWRGAASGTVEAKVSKPRSLANSDDSRFS